MMTLPRAGLRPSFLHGHFVLVWHPPSQSQGHFGGR